jgi:hypothetical protein
MTDFNQIWNRTKKSFSQSTKIDFHFRVFTCLLTDTRMDDANLDGTPNYAVI